MSTDAVSRVFRTFLIAFLGVSIPGALSWLHNLTTWANDGGQSAFPDWHSLAFLGISAIVAGFIAVLNWVVVAIEDWTGKGFLRTPTKVVRNAGGYIEARVVLIAAAVVVVILLLFALVR